MSGWITLGIGVLAILGTSWAIVFLPLPAHVPHRAVLEVSYFALLVSLVVGLALGIAA